MDIVYLDEYMLTTKLMMEKEYAVKSKNIEVDQKTTNTVATACIAAISSGKGMVHNAVYDNSVDSVKFIGFLRRIMDKYGDDPFIIYMDSLRVHLSVKT